MTADGPTSAALPNFVTYDLDSSPKPVLQPDGTAALSAAENAFWAADDRRVDALENEPDIDLVTKAAERARQARAKLTSVRSHLGDLAYDMALAMD